MDNLWISQSVATYPQAVDNLWVSPARLLDVRLVVEVEPVVRGQVPACVAIGEAVQAESVQ